MLGLFSVLPNPAVKALIGAWRLRWLGVAIAWIIALAGWGMLTRLPDLYESRAQVYINTETALDSTISEVAARPNLEKGVQVIRLQLLSRDNMERLIYDTGLDAKVRNEIQLQRMIDRLSEDIQVLMLKPGYFTFQYADKDPEMAQRVVASLLDLFIEQNLSTASADVNSAIQNLDREMALRKKDLDEIDASISEFRRLNAQELAGASRQARLLDAKTVELARTEDGIALAEVRVQRLRAAISEIPRYSSGSSLDALKLQLATLQTQFTDEYPDIVRLKAQIAELESGSSALPQNPVYTEAVNALQSASDELRSLLTRHDRIQSDIEQLLLTAAQTPEAEARLQSLLRERERIEKTYTQIATERTKLDVSANLNRGGGAIDYTRFEAPKVAAEPIWPPRGLFVLGIALFAVCAGIGAVTLIGLFDRTYTQPSDLENSFGLEVLGSVSPAPSLAKKMSIITERMTLFGSVVSLLILAGALSWWIGNQHAPESGSVIETTGAQIAIR